MKSLGDHGWLNQYIGIPYQPGGRTVDGLDCYGLCKMIYWDVFDQRLPDWQTDDMTLPERALSIARVVTGGTWMQREEPFDGCFVVCYRDRAAYHLGLYFAGGVVHSYDGCGVIYEPLARFAQRFARIEYGAWSP